MDALKLWLRRGLFAFGALAALAGVAYGGVHLYTYSALKAPPPPVAFGQLPAGDAGEGARLAHVLGCRACHTPDLGEAHEVLPVEYGGSAMQICFNADYVDNFLNVVETENVQLEFKDEMSQAVVKPIGAEGYEYTYVIMPMRI